MMIFFQAKKNTNISNSDSFISLFGNESNLSRPQINHNSQHKNKNSVNDNNITSLLSYSTEQPHSSKCSYFNKKIDASTLLDELMEVIDGK